MPTANSTSARIDTPQRDDIKAEQVTSTAHPPRSELFQVEQVALDDQPLSYEFSYVEGDDPCSSELNANTAQCRQISSESHGEIASGRSRGSSSALSELQTILPEIVDPSTFDAERTASEIGRSDLRLRSQAAMAVGAEFLAPPLPAEPEQASPDALEVDGTLLLDQPLHSIESGN